MSTEDIPVSSTNCKYNEENGHKIAAGDKGMAMAPANFDSDKSSWRRMIIGMLSLSHNLQLTVTVF